MKPGRTDHGPERSRRVPSTDCLHDGHGRPIRTLRLSVTDRCNHRCLYCMPEQGIRLLPRDSVMRIEEIAAITEILSSVGINRVRITGGEPLVRGAVTELVSHIVRIPGIDSVAMTTNASLLAPVATQLKKAGLTRLNASLDTLKPERFCAISRRATLASVLGGLEAARRAGFGTIHLNTVVVRGFNDDELMDICRYAWNLGGIPRFIELMPTAHTGYFSPEKLVGSDEVRAVLESASSITSTPADKPLGFGPARYYTLGAGRLFGVIPSITGHICGTCDRIRLRATGELQTCLVRPAGPNLREALHAGGPDMVLRWVRRAIREKVERPSELSGPSAAMSSVGG